MTGRRRIFFHKEAVAQLSDLRGQLGEHYFNAVWGLRDDEQAARQAERAAGFPKLNGVLRALRREPDEQRAAILLAAIDVVIPFQEAAE